jgi:hypothetical protein
MAEIINFNEKESQRIIKELQDLLKRNIVENLVLTYSRKPTPEEIEERGNDCDIIYRYWFGESSSIYCLGLVENMAHIIKRYANGEDLLVCND